MRTATVRVDGELTGALVEGDRLVLVDAPDAVQALLRHDRLRRTGEVPAAGAHHARTSPRPAHVVCVGLNYRSHIAELGLPTPEHPALFAKYASTLTGPQDAITVPAVSDRVEVEVELTVVIGRPLHRAGVAEAAASIAGYTVANDLSMRDWQFRTSEALQGKTFERSTPLGPVLVTPDELDDARDLALTCTVDGQVQQRGSTGDMLFSPAELVAYCSQFIAWQPGDLLLTGTPGALGGGRSVRAGQQMVTAIEGIGACTNPMTADPLPDARDAWRAVTGPTVPGRTSTGTTAGARP